MGHELKIMGIVNVTPDSFSDGGHYHDPQKAIEHGLRLIKEGADVLDIGGESTRPNADIVTPAEEQERVLPVIKGLRDTGVLLSIDTRNASTMAKALKYGARMINDVSALTHDTDSINVAKDADYVCLMHMSGTPQTMQDRPEYDDVVRDVFKYLEGRIHKCCTNGIAKEKIVADIGIGFGKTLQHNLSLLKHIKDFHALGVPLMIGTSRKSFIEKVCGQTIAPENRVGGSLASALWAAEQGVSYLRVHDVVQTVQALSIIKAINS